MSVTMVMMAMMVMMSVEGRAAFLDLDSTQPHYAYATLMFSDEVGLAVLVLGKSIDKHSQSSATPYSKIVLHTADIREEMLALLRAENWLPIEVSVLAPETGALLPKYAKSFTKLHLWSLTQFKRIIYLDADMLVLSPISELFIDCKSPLCAVADVPQVIANKFNAGLLVLAPSLQTYQSMLAEMETFSTSTRKYAFAEQDYLNDVFPFLSERFNLRRSIDDNKLPSNGQQIPAAYNMMASMCFQSPTGAAHVSIDDIKVLHYTQFKPWKWYFHPFSPVSCHWWAQRQELMSSNPAVTAVVGVDRAFYLLVTLLGMSLLIPPIFSELRHKCSSLGVAFDKVVLPSWTNLPIIVAAQIVSNFAVFFFESLPTSYELAWITSGCITIAVSFCALVVLRGGRISLTWRYLLFLSPVLWVGVYIGIYTYFGKCAFGDYPHFYIALIIAAIACFEVHLFLTAVYYNHYADVKKRFFNLCALPHREDDLQNASSNNIQ